MSVSETLVAEPSNPDAATPLQRCRRMWRHRNENLRRRLQCLPVLGRRGGIAAMLAVSSTVLIGFVGLAVEGGTWYLAARNVSTAVDLAALAGAAALDRGQAPVTDLITTGDCTGCASGDVYTDSSRTTRPDVVSSRPYPINDPFAGLQTWTPTPPAACQTVALGGNDKTATISPDASICSSLSIRSQDTLTLNPGIYYFKNGADLTVQGTINGNGVTLVFTGDVNNVGTIKINAQAGGALRGPAGTLIPGHDEAAGLLIYRDARATNNGIGKEVQLNGGATMSLFGGLYFPTSNVVVNGNSDVGYSACHAVVGYRLYFSGSSNTELDVSQCSGFTTVPTIRVARLVE